MAHAKVVARALEDAFRSAGVPWFRMNPPVPHTHQFQVWLPYPAEALDEASVSFAEETRTTVFGVWTPSPVPGVSFTEVTVGASALGWTAADVRDAAGGVLRRIRADGSRAER